MSDTSRHPFKDVELSEEQRAAVHAAILAEIQGFNLELLNDIVGAILRDTFRAREDSRGGVLDDWREVPIKEQMHRDYGPTAVLSYDEMQPMLAVKSIDELKAMTFDELCKLRGKLTGAAS